MGTTVKPYNETDTKKEQVAQMFDNIAPSYDLLNRVLTMGIDTLWRKKAINLLKARNPKKLLDVATGTADVALEIEKCLEVDQVIGMDISKEMIEYGNKKIAKQGKSNKIQLELGDSENMRYVDDEFDAITVAFGVRNFENLDKGLAEMARVLKPNGQLMVLELSKPKLFPFKQVFNMYFKYVLPLIGRLTSKDPRAYKYLYESVQAFPEGDDFLNRLNNAGFKNSKCIPLTLGISSIYLAEK